MPVSYAEVLTDAGGDESFEVVVPKRRLCFE